MKSNVVENGAKIGAAPSHGEGPSTALLAAMQEGFATLPGNMASAISEAFKSAKADLEISFGEETHKRKIDCMRLLSCPEIWLMPFPRLISRLKHSYDGNS